MSDYTEAPDNRPERCGYMRAGLRRIIIEAETAAKHYADPGYHASLLAAVREIAKHATETITEDDASGAANRAEFERWMNRDAGRCATCHRSAHYSNDAPGNHGHPYAAPSAKIQRDLRGVTVRAIDDDGPAPRTGVILDRAGTAGDEFVWVVWDHGANPQPAVREAIDGLMPASGGTL